MVDAPDSLEPAGASAVEPISNPSPALPVDGSSKQSANQSTLEWLAERRGGNGDIHFFLSLLLVAVTSFVFVQVRRHLYVWDDGENVFRNPHLNPVTVEGVKHFWTEPYVGLYIPLTYTLFAIEATIAGQPLDQDGLPLDLPPKVFHTGNLVLHCACVILVFTLLWDLVGHAGGAFGGALLFALHPLQVESVAWVTETKGLLCAFFTLCALMAYLKAGGLGQEQSVERRSPGLLILAAACYLLALLSKPNAVVAPLIAGIIEVGYLRRSIGFCLRGLAWWIVPALAIVMITRSAQGPEFLTEVPPWWQRPFVAADALTFYLGKVVLPVSLGPDYGRTPTWVLAQTWVYLLPLALIALTVVLSRLPNRRIWLTSLALFAGWLVPVLGFLPFGFQSISTTADRYAYLAMLGPSLALAWSLSHWWRAAAISSAAVVLAVLGFLSFHQAGHWLDMATLFEHGLTVNPQSTLAHGNLGAVYGQNKRYEASIDHYRQLLEARPRDWGAHLGIMSSYLGLNKPQEALAHGARMVDKYPNDPQAHATYGQVLEQVGRNQDAERQFREAQRLDPENASALFGLASVLAETGRFDDATPLLEKTVKLRPDDARAWYYLGNRHLTKGSFDAALDAYRRSLRAAPQSDHGATALSWLLATHPDSKARSGQEALRLANRVCRHSDFKDPLALDALAAACAEVGRFDDAIKHATKALSLIPPDLRVRRDAIQRRILLYGSGKAFRTPRPSVPSGPTTNPTGLTIPDSNSPGSMSPDSIRPGANFEGSLAPLPNLAPLTAPSPSAP